MAGFNDLLNKVNSEIEKINFPDSPTYLYEPIKYSLAAGGKRIRPVYTLMACEIFSSSTERALNPAIAIEIFHNFTLLHDDIMDKSAVRRNKPTVFKKWNENVAILSGDAMMIMAYEYISRTPVDILHAVLDIFNKTSLEVCEGQQYDMDFEDRMDVKVNEYIEMISLKTASLIASSLKIGAVCGGASPDDAEKIFCFGKNIGIAFQLQDDLLDVYGDPGTFGKSTANDIVGNKKTYLLITALDILKGNEREELIQWIQKEEFDRDEKIKAVLSLYDKANVKNLTEKMIETYFSTAEECMKELSVTDEKKMLLKEISGVLFKRER